jgi:hypothetical protein
MSKKTIFWPENVSIAESPRSRGRSGLARQMRSAGTLDSCGRVAKRVRHQGERAGQDGVVGQCGTLPQARFLEMGAGALEADLPPQQRVR